MKGLVIAIILVISIFLNNQAKADSVEDLRKQIMEKQQLIEKLEQQAKEYQESIFVRQKEAKSLKNKLAILEMEIKKLKTKINLIQNKIYQSNLKIEELQGSIYQKNQEIKEQKKYLAEIIRAIDEYDKINTLDLILNYNNFSDLLNHIEYIQLLQGRIQEKLERIKFLKSELESEKKEIENKKLNLKQFKNNLSVQQGALDSQKEYKIYLLRKTQGEEKKYQSLLAKINSQKAILMQEIREMEARISAQKKFIIFVQAERIPPPQKLFIWPERNFILTQTYGMTDFAKHGCNGNPCYGGAPHNGIDMTAGFGSQIVSIGQGSVLAKGYNKGWGNWIAILHSGNLVSLYAHLIKLPHLAIGASVKAGEVIGYEGKTGFATGSHLHLSLYHKFFTYLRGNEVYFNYFEGTLNPLSYLQ